MSNEKTVELQEVEPQKQDQSGAMALVTLKPEKYAAEVYAPFKASLVAAIESVRNIDYDIKTTKGLEIATKARRMMIDIRVGANKEREIRKAPITLIGRLLQSRYAEVEESILPLENFFDEEIKAEELRKKEANAAKVAAERARVEAIQARIDYFSKLVLMAVGQGSVEIDRLQQILIASEPEITEELFDGFVEKAKTAHAEATTALQVACKAAIDAEQAAEAARIKREEEDRQRREEAAKLEEQRAEQAKVAAAQAAESKRLADLAAAQQAANDRQQREAAARMAEAAKAEETRQKAAADAETARIGAEAEKHSAEMKRQSDELAAQRADFEAKQAAVRQAEEKVAKEAEDAAMLERDHVEALEMNASHDIAHAAWLESQLISATENSASDPVIDAALDASEEYPSDAEIIEAYIQAFGGSDIEAIERLKRLVAAQP